MSTSPACVFAVNEEQDGDRYSRQEPPHLQFLTLLARKKAQPAGPKGAATRESSILTHLMRVDQTAQLNSTHPHCRDSSTVEQQRRTLKTEVDSFARLQFARQAFWGRRCRRTENAAHPTRPSHSLFCLARCGSPRKERFIEVSLDQACFTGSLKPRTQDFGSSASVEFDANANPDRCRPCLDCRSEDSGFVVA